MPHFPASFGAGALWASSQLPPVLLEDLAAHSSADHTGAHQSQERWEVVSNHVWGYPLWFGVCVDTLSDHEVLRVRNVYLKALDDFLVLLSLQTTVTKWLGLNLLLHCCSYRRQADVMPIRPAGGIRSRLLLCVQAACHSLQKSRSLHVCRVTVVKLLSRERKSGFFKTLVMTGW